MSIAIASYQRKGPLLELLGSIADALDEDDPIEVVVVLDGSTDGSREALTTNDFGLGARFRWQWQPNAGPAATRNAGLAASRGQFCLMIDDDMIIDRCMITHHLDFQRRCITPTVLLGPHREPAPELDGPSAAVRSFVAARNARLERVGVVTDPFDFWTGVMSGPRRELLDLGGFDERFHGWGEEDVEFGFRLIEAGVPIRFEAGAGADHRRHRRPGQAIAAQRQRGRNLVRLCELHPQALDRVDLMASPVVTAYELGITSPRLYGAAAQAAQLVLRAPPVRKSRLRKPLLRLGSDVALLAGALERDAPRALVHRLMVRDRSFAADVRPPTSENGLVVAAGGGAPPSSLLPSTEYETTGMIRACRSLADASVVPRLVADGPGFVAAVADLNRRGQRRVPYQFTPAIRDLVTDRAIVDTVEDILGTERWVAWGPNIQLGTPNAAHNWHTDIESDHWPSITVVVGLSGCAETNATRYIPGTHRFTSSPLALADPTDDQLVLATARRLDPRCDTIVRFEGFADGRFYLFDAGGWHCGDTELSTDRLSLLFHYQPADDLRVPYMKDYRRGRWYGEAAPYVANPALGADFQRQVQRPPAPPRMWAPRRIRPLATRVRRRLKAGAASVTRRSVRG